MNCTPANVSCVGDHSPTLHKTGISSRKGEGLPGSWAVLFICVLVEHPARYVPPLAHLTQRRSSARIASHQETATFIHRFTVACICPKSCGCSPRCAWTAQLWTPAHALHAETVRSSNPKPRR